jgi:C4-dicarboxylate-binding protein DctP
LLGSWRRRNGCEEERRGPHHEVSSDSTVSAVLVLALAGCGLRGGGADKGREGGAYTIRFSHVVTPETPKGLASERFKELVEEKSGGEISVEIYPNSSLYGDEDEMQALQSGSVQMLAPAGAKFRIDLVR